MKMYHFISLLSCFIFSGATLSAEETRSFLAADSSKGRIAILNEAGNMTWEYKIGPLHDLHRLENGNILFQKNWTHLVEVNPQTQAVVWEYDCAKQNRVEKPLEVHAFQRLANGNTMIAESGRSRIIEIDTAGKLLQNIPLQVKKSHAHTDTRLVRKTAKNTYLVCHEADGLIKEYDSTGKVVWEYNVPLFDKQPAGGHGVEAFGNKCFSAVRLANGNTLIGTGNGHSVIEVTPQKEIVWSVHQNDLPDIQFAWITSIQVLPSGNISITNCHAGEKNPQIVEITKEKKVVWTFRDFERFGNSFTNTQILSVNGTAIDDLKLIP
jgi:outer membrane protein assembly factor BamB